MSPTNTSRLQHALVLIGPAASGKSTVGRLLAAELSWPLLSFGAYVRDEAQRRGIPVDHREELERLGAHLIVTRGHDRFLQDLLESQSPVERVILEGIRHVEMLRAVKRAYPAVCSIYLDVADEFRYQRWRLREGRPDSAECRAVFNQIGQAEVERHVYSLSGEVDHLEEATRPARAVVEDILRFLTDHPR